MIGQTISHYQILEKLGKGGMGEVYLAHDTELDRRIALKILAAEIASDPERRERFRGEAKAVAALNHPNIVTIHSIEAAKSEGFGELHFITMELVEGKTLDQLISPRGLPLARFFESAVPLANAVSAAHARGIIHRDLKPRNIMVDNEGSLKILDFGLAKLRAPVSAAEATELTTESFTKEGRILGTVPYMSPEQLQGQTVDHRSDIFSLGMILFEMATGQHPFQGKTSAELISSIRRDTPSPVTGLNPELPHHLGRIIRHCLEKDPEHRYQVAKDVRNELQGLWAEVNSDELVESRFPATPWRPRRSRHRRQPGQYVYARPAVGATWSRDRARREGGPRRMTRLLLVEDDPSLARGLADNFRDEGFEVHLVERGDEALSAVREFRPNLLVLDIMLPGRSGLDILRDLRASGDPLPVLMLTAKGEAVDRVVGIELGADDYLPKPFVRQELLARVRALLRRGGYRLAPA